MKSFHMGQTDNSSRGMSQRTMTTMSGDIGRAYRRNLPSGVECQTANVGGPTARPEKKGLDRLWLKWRKGVGAAIVVGDGERPSQGEGPQGLERNLSVRSP